MKNLSVSKRASINSAKRLIQANANDGQDLVDNAKEAAKILNEELPKLFGKHAKDFYISASADDNTLDIYFISEPKTASRTDMHNTKINFVFMMHLRTGSDEPMSLGEQVEWKLLRRSSGASRNLKYRVIKAKTPKESVKGIEQWFKKNMNDILEITYED